MAGQDAPRAIVPSAVRRCHSRRRLRSPRSGAPAATDRLAPWRTAMQPGARQRPRPGAEIGDGKVSFEPPSRFHLFDHLRGATRQWKRDTDTERLGGLEVVLSRFVLELRVTRSPAFPKVTSQAARSIGLSMVLVASIACDAISGISESNE